MSMSTQAFRPVISVVIPVHNRRHTITYCLESVLNQSYSPSEVVVVDDSSTDGTAETVSRFRDGRVKLLQLTRRSGAQTARNQGITAARGDWIAFQDSDDEWLPVKLELQVQALNLTEFDSYTVVHGNGWRLDHQTGAKSLIDMRQPVQISTYAAMLKSSGTLFPTILTSRKALEEIGLLDEAVPSFQEWDTSIRLAKICRFIHVPEPLFIYHVNHGETISRDMRRDILGVDYVLRKFGQAIVEMHGIGFLQSRCRWNIERALEFGFWDLATEMFHNPVAQHVSFSLDLWLMTKLRVRPTQVSRVKRKLWATGLPTLMHVFRSVLTLRSQR